MRWEKYGWQLSKITNIFTNATPRMFKKFNTHHHRRVIGQLIDVTILVVRRLPPLDARQGVTAADCPRGLQLRRSSLDCNVEAHVTELGFGFGLVLIVSMDTVGLCDLDERHAFEDQPDVADLGITAFAAVLCRPPRDGEQVRGSGHHWNVQHSRGPTNANPCE